MIILSLIAAVYLTVVAWCFAEREIGRGNPNFWALGGFLTGLIWLSYLSALLV